MAGTLADYPWDNLAPYRDRAAAHPGGIVDLSAGSPVDPTPASVRQALSAATDAHSYPLTLGTQELREAIVGWFLRRRSVDSLTGSQVLPCIGSKELVAWLPLMLGLGGADVVVHPRISYPTYAVGAQLAGAKAFAADDPDEWPPETKLIWLNSPANPDGRVLTSQQLSHAVDRARKLGAVLVNDECYAEFGWAAEWRERPVPSILQPEICGGKYDSVLAVYSLSKQSNLAGYRAGFVAGDHTLISRLLTIRKHAGMIVPAPVQAAMVAALADDEHVALQKERYRGRRNLLKPALEHYGFRIDHSEAGLYLWATRAHDSWGSIADLAELGILAVPGTFFGEHSSQHVRFSLTASEERMRQAATRLVAATD